MEPSRPLSDEIDISEETLPDPEWPGRAVTVLDVSFETSESGRGMNSKVSENPTLARMLGLAIFKCSSGVALDELGLPVFLLSWPNRTGSGRGKSEPMLGKSSLRLNIVGLLGALFP